MKRIPRFAAASLAALGLALAAPAARADESGPPPCYDKGGIVPKLYPKDAKVAAALQSRAICDDTSGAPSCRFDWSEDDGWICFPVLLYLVHAGKTPEVIAAALQELSVRGGPEYYADAPMHLPVLRKAMAHPSARVAHAAMEAASEFWPANRKLHAALLSACRTHPHSLVRDGACLAALQRALPTLSDEKPLEAPWSALDGADAYLVTEAIRSLTPGATSIPEAEMSRFLRLAESPDPAVRGAALELALRAACGTRAWGSVSEVGLAALRDPVKHVRGKAGYGLAKCVPDDWSLIDALVPLLEEGEMDLYARVPVPPLEAIPGVEPAHVNHSAIAVANALEDAIHYHAPEDRKLPPRGALDKAAAILLWWKKNGAAMKGPPRPLR